MNFATHNSPQEEAVRGLIRRAADSSVLIIWGTVLCYFCFSGRIEAYLHPWFHLPTMLSGIFLNLFGVIVFLAGGTAECDCTDPDCVDPPGRKWRFLLPFWSVLIVPLLAAAIASPSQFGATAVLNRGLVHSLEQLPMAGSFAPFVDEPLPTPSGLPGEPWGNDPSMDVSTYLMKTEDGHILAETIDLLFAAQEDPIRKDFENQPIEIIGQFLPEKPPRGTPGDFQLVRVFIMCCAADGRPIGITVKGQPSGEIPEMGWIRVRGVAKFPVVSGKRVPVIEATTIEETTAPRQPFLY